MNPSGVSNKQTCTPQTHRPTEHHSVATNPLLLPEPAQTAGSTAHRPVAGKWGAGVFYGRPGPAERSQVSVTNHLPTSTIRNVRVKIYRLSYWKSRMKSHCLRTKTKMEIGLPVNCTVLGRSKFSSLLHEIVHANTCSCQLDLTFNSRLCLKVCFLQGLTIGHIKLNTWLCMCWDKGCTQLDCPNWQKALWSYLYHPTNMSNH